MKYMIVTEWRQAAFEKVVQKFLDEQKFLNEGWTLQGSITVNSHTGEIYTAQALVKEKE
jgi:hypothetical protein